MNLRLHVHHVRTGGWCADIDDDLDRQPDDPYWCVDQWPTLQDALDRRLRPTGQVRHRHPPRVSGQRMAA